MLKVQASMERGLHASSRIAGYPLSCMWSCVHPQGDTITIYIKPPRYCYECAREYCDSRGESYRGIEATGLPVAA